jgi:trk system potassium uptake protein TrkA
MKIIITGGGVVGYALAEHLLADNHQLTMIEQDEKLCQAISAKLDVQIIQGNASSPELLKEAGIASTDMVLAVTPNDEVNMVVCALAAQYNVGQRIARLRSEEFIKENAAVDLGGIGITSVIHPEKVLADQILQYVGSPHAVEAANFEEGRILLRGYRVRENMALAGRTPQEIREMIAPTVVLFAAIDRSGTGMIPTGNTRIEPGDIIYSLFPRDSLDTFLKLVGIEHKKNRKVIMTGDTFATYAVAQALDRTDHKVTFVDPNIKHAEKVAGSLGGMEVIHGDCTDDDLLRELNIDKASFFISVSDASDYNILSALLAKVEGAHEVIATTIDTRHERLYRSIGIDHTINPRLTAARAILDIISRGHIGAAVQLSGIDIEAVRYTVEPESDIAGLKVKQVARKLKRGSIIGVIVRHNQMILPGGETVVEEGDHVIVITHHKNLSALAKLFKPRGLFTKG